MSGSIPTSKIRRGFTLIELLVVIMLIGIMASFVLVALTSATQSAKEDRTTAQIKRIHELVMEKWEQYQYMQVPPTDRTLAFQRPTEYAPGTGIPTFMGVPIRASGLAIDRLQSIREVMRMELPTFQEDILGGPKQLSRNVFGQPYVPRVTRAYVRRVAEAENETGIPWSDSTSFQDAECLYMILAEMRTGDSSALSFFKENEIGDVDGDGMKEILDAWGNPIRWSLWAPAYESPLQRKLSEDPQQQDIFDISEVGSGYDLTRFQGEFDLPRSLYPLVYSGGPDGVIGTLPWVQDKGGVQNWAAAGSDPFNRNAKYEMYRIGAINPDFPGAIADDISNHFLSTR